MTARAKAAPAPGAGGRRSAAAAVCTAILLASSCTSSSHSSSQPSSSATQSLAPTPPAEQVPLLTSAKVDSAVSGLDAVVKDALAKTGVPGAAVGIVYQGKVLSLKGYGLRKVGSPEAVDPDTVFELASLSKPLASTVVAAAVGQKALSWDDPVTKYDPGFALKDPNTTAQVTVADLFSHRSGLPDHAGDLLEDLGFDQGYILQHLRQEPLGPFRAVYHYTNFGLTEAALAAAKAKGVAWEDLSQQELYGPLGMKSTSSRYADYAKASDKAALHVKIDGSWQAKYTRDADAQSPAGGASSTVRDMAQWMLLQLGDGKFGGKQIVDEDSLAQTRLPHILSSPPPAPAGRAGFYGLGMNVRYDDYGRLQLSHSGAFELGAATNVFMLPSEQLGIIVLTNGSPIGLPEAVANSFIDLAQNGKLTVDWLGFYGKLFSAINNADKSPTDYSKPPTSAPPAKADSAYTGTYANSYYGSLTVKEASGGGLVMVLGPNSMEFPLTHYSGDTFSYQTTGENAVGLSGVTFTVKGSHASGVTVENLNKDGLGTFTSG